LRQIRGSVTSDVEVIVVGETAKLSPVQAVEKFNVEFFDWWGKLEVFLEFF
jgi:hypothetical protein